MKALGQTTVRRPPPSPRRVTPTNTKRIGRAYWLAHCEGYRVDAGNGRVGFVEEIRDGRVPMLVIRAGWLGRRLLLVPTAEVDFIVPRAQHIWLRSPGLDPRNRSPRVSPTESIMS